MLEPNVDKGRRVFGEKAQRVEEREGDVPGKDKVLEQRKALQRHANVLAHL